MNNLESLELIADLFSGSTLFELKATRGFPLDFALDRIINDRGLRVDWVGFIDTARKNKWWDYETLNAVSYALEDAQVPKDMREGIIQRMKLYMLKVPHPAL